MNSILDFLIIIIYTETVYIFCPLGSSNLSNRTNTARREHGQIGRNGGKLFHFIP